MANGLASTCEKQAKVIVDLGLRCDGRTRISRRVLLPDGDRRGKPGDLIHVRLVHPFEELTGIGRKRLNITPLAFGVDRVERKAGLARAGNAGYHCELVVRE